MAGGMRIPSGGLLRCAAIAIATLPPATARATYSVVATDSATFQVGGAVTSCVGASGVGVVYRGAPGHGAVNAQASANAGGRDRAVMLLNSDVAPADIITMITTSSFDANAATRQYGVVDVMGRAAGYTGARAMDYKEDRQGTIGSYTYSVQGNILTSRAVIDQAEGAFRGQGCDLADKLMMALDGGAQNGEGDSRCASRGIPSDAASLQVDLAGGTAGSYLALSVAGTGNNNPVAQIRTMFDDWRATHPCPAPAPTAADAGCGCAVGSSATPRAIAAALFVVAFATQRRRRASRRPPRRVADRPLDASTTGSGTGLSARR